MTAKPAPAPSLWLDVETNGVHYTRRAWEVAAILRPAGGSRDDDTEHHWFVHIDDIDRDGADPHALEIGGFWQRHPQANPDAPQLPVFREKEVLAAVADLTAGKAVVRGSNPAFDTYTLGPRMEAPGGGVNVDWMSDGICLQHRQAFDRARLPGRARHLCLRHCPVLEQCKGWARPHSWSGLVVAGAAWAHVNDGAARLADPQPRESSRGCPVCADEVAA